MRLLKVVLTGMLASAVCACAPSSMITASLIKPNPTITKESVSKIAEAADTVVISFRSNPQRSICNDYRRVDDAYIYLGDYAFRSPDKFSLTDLRCVIVGKHTGAGSAELFLTAGNSRAIDCKRLRQVAEEKGYLD